ncbi:MAG: hypothetical protein KME64_01400 [Scytonematopsis contorta HA4267-MV1]|jgi:hypothetical protein|nr:hypothetical protein [Scytonematopsis contorta HA4267-MV1]
MNLKIYSVRNVQIKKYPKSSLLESVTLLTSTGKMPVLQGREFNFWKFFRKAFFCISISTIAGLSYSQSAMAFDFDEAFKTIICRAFSFESGQCREKVNTGTVTPQQNPITDTAPNSRVPNSNSNFNSDSYSGSNQEETNENNSSESSQSSESYIFQNSNDTFPNRK